MSSSNQVSEVLARVEGATGPDRELDREIIDALGFHSWAGRMSYRTEDRRSFDFGSSDVTASIDAALALVQRVFAEGMPYPVEMTLSSVGSVGPWRAAIWVGVDCTDGVYCSAANPALAILAALLRALASQETDRGMADEPS